MQDLIIGSIPLLIAFFVSLVRYKKLEPAWLRLFTWFLLATFLIQTGGYYYSVIYKYYYSIVKSNHFIFNCYTLIEYSFYLFIFYKALSRDIFKKIALFLNVLFIALFIYCIFIHGSFWEYNTLIGNIGQFLTLCCCFLYLAELLMTEEAVNYFTIPMFWITTGIMLSAVGNFLYLCFFNYIIKNNLDPYGEMYGIITTSLSVIEYGFFTIGFLCKKAWIKTK